jgi:hypothetical protein
LIYACEVLHLLVTSPRKRAAMPSNYRHVSNHIAIVQSITGNISPRISFITDGANGLQAIARQLRFPTKPILDWFHISMRVRYLEQIDSSCARLLPNGAFWGKDSLHIVKISCIRTSAFFALLCQKCANDKRCGGRREAFICSLRFDALPSTET